MNTNESEKILLPLINGNALPTKDIKVFENIIGQKSAVGQLKYWISNYSDKICFPDLLFTGSPGLGKTMMARKVAEAIGRELIEINCSTIKTVDDFVMGTLIGRILGKNPKTIFFDEAHVLSKDIVELLKTLLSVENSNKKYLDYTYRIEYDSSKINTIFATTDANLMDKALLNRLEEIYFATYDNEDLFGILRTYLPETKISCNKNDIAYACRGRARDAVKLSKKIKMYCYGHNTNILNSNGWLEIKNTFGIFPYGLYTKEVELIKILYKNPSLSSSNIAAKMGVNISNVEDEIETRPRELGFIATNSKGRYLTDKGINYIKLIK